MDPSHIPQFSMCEKDLIARRLLEEAGVLNRDHGYSALEFTIESALGIMHQASRGTSL